MNVAYVHYRLQQRRSEPNQNRPTRRHIGFHEDRTDRENRNSSKRYDTENERITDDVTSISNVFCDFRFFQSLYLFACLQIGSFGSGGHHRSRFFMVRPASLRLMYTPICLQYFKLLFEGEGLLYYRFFVITTESTFSSYLLVRSNIFVKFRLQNKYQKFLW